jgi:hypothetical protein
MDGDAGPQGGKKGIDADVKNVGQSFYFTL